LQLKKGLGRFGMNDNNATLCLLEMEELEVYELLPKIIQEISDVIGIDNALKFTARYRGTMVWVPKNICETHEIAKIVGIEAAKKLSFTFANESLTIPVLNKLESRIRAISIEKDRRSGMGINQLASKYKLTSRSIYIKLSKVKTSMQSTKNSEIENGAQTPSHEHA